MIMAVLQQKQIMSIIFLRMFIPKLAKLFMWLGLNNKILKDGTIRAMLSAYAIPTKLKYECLPPSTFVKGLPPGRLL
jgi:hypothetical protein